MTKRNLFYYGSMTAALVIGLLQMFRVRAGVVTSYGADLLGTVWLYAMFRQGRTILRRGRPLSAAAAAGVVFAGCAISEVAQNVHWMPGTFDSIDFLCFAVAVGGASVADRLWGPLT